MMKAIFQRWFFCTISITAALIAALGMLQSFRNRDALGFAVSLVLFIADGMFAHSLWPGEIGAEEDEDVTQTLPMPQVPEPITETLVSIWPDGDVVERILIEQQREMQQLLGEQQEGDEG